MSLIHKPTSAARAIEAMLQAATSVQRHAVNQWPECYTEKPETYLAPVTRYRLKVVDGVRVEPPEQEAYEFNEERTRMVPDIEAIQQFYDDAEAVFPGGGLALCLGLAGFGVAANYVHALDLNDGVLPPDLQSSANQFFGAAIAFREALKSAGVPEWVPLTPPVQLMPTEEGIQVSAFDTEPAE